MASFTSAYSYQMNEVGENSYRIMSTSTVTISASNGEGGSAFALRELITGQGLPSPGLTYLGYHLNGWLGLTAGEDEVYFLSNDVLPTGTTFSPSMDPFTPPCFLAGTLIATPMGCRPVEELTIGDQVLTADGRSVPVRWVGWRTVATAFGPPHASAPVVIAAGAFGPSLPVRPLRLTADHALLLGGLLVQAGALVDGLTVRRLTGAELGELYTVFHVETEHHDLILAEGVPAETFLDTVTRRRFDNFAEYGELYGDAAPIVAEMTIPRVKSARQLPRAVRECLSGRATVTHGADMTAA